VTGIKHYQGKAPLSLIPYEYLTMVAQVFDFGAKKYGRYNYRGGMEWSRVGDAALRHLNAFMNGEDNDEESGMSHLGHAGCCIAMLAFYKLKGVGLDNRPKPTLQPVNAQILPLHETKKT
jgi:hypothetical protein